MSYQELLRLTIGAMLILLTLIGCVTPAATPTSVPPTATQTALPPTNTPTSPQPTVTPTPEPPTAMSTKDSTLATSAEEILGTWYEGRDYIRFDEDETFRQAHGLDKLDDSPYAIGSYQFEGTILIIKEISVSGVPPCKSKIGSYEIQVLENGDIKIVKVEDECSPRAADISGVKKSAVSPTP